MRASFTACVGGGIPSPLNVDRIILSRLCSSYYHYNTFQIVWVLIFGFLLCVIRNTQLMYVLFNSTFLPVNVAFVPPWKQFLIEACHVTHRI